MNWKLILLLILAIAVLGYLFYRLPTYWRILKLRKMAMTAQNQPSLECSFNRNRTATLLSVRDSAIESLVLPNIVIHLGKRYFLTEVAGFAFDNCGKLKEVWIPVSVKKVWSDVDTSRNLVIFYDKKRTKILKNAFTSQSMLWSASSNKKKWSS